MSRRMPEDEARAFFNHDRRTGTIATLRKDGSPHLSPICVMWEGDDAVFTTWHQSAKAKEIARDPRVTICVDHGDSYVEVRGTARIMPEDLEESRRIWLILGARFVGEEHAEAMAQRNAVPGELVVRVAIGKVVAIADIAS